MKKELYREISKSSPYSKHLHMELLEAEEGYARVSMEIEPYHINRLGVVHGGAIASLADQTGMKAIQTKLSIGQGSPTVQMDTHYLAPAQSGLLIAVGRVKKMGKHIAFCDVEIEDEKGKTIAVARCTVMIGKHK